MRPAISGRNEKDSDAPQIGQKGVPRVSSAPQTGHLINAALPDDGVTLSGLRPSGKREHIAFKYVICSHVTGRTLALTNETGVRIAAPRASCAHAHLPAGYRHSRKCAAYAYAYAYAGWPGGPAGFVSGMSGVGGGFLMTPVLMFAGVPDAAAAAGSLLGVEIVSLLRQAGQLRCGSACPAG